MADYCIKELKDVVLVMAEVGGHTRAMSSGTLSRAHRHIIVRELMDSVLREVRPPLCISKTEGDAIFMYAPSEDTHKGDIGVMLIEFFTAFIGSLERLRATDLCPCRFCRSLDRLRLRVVAHVGGAFMCHIVDKEELSGPDVVLVHSLLDNSVQMEQYVLLTESANRVLAARLEGEPVTGHERYGDMQTVKTYAYAMPPGHSYPILATRRYAPLAHRLGRTWKLFAGALSYMTGGVRKSPRLRE